MERVEPEKLVLTPALRVDHEDERPDPSVTPEADTAAPEEAAAEPQQDDGTPDEDVFAEEEPDLSAADTTDAPDPAEQHSASGQPDEGSDHVAEPEPHSAEPHFAADQGADGGRAEIFQRVADTNDEEWEPDDGTDPSPPPTEALAWQDATPDSEPPAEQHAADEMEGLSGFSPEPDDTPEETGAASDLYVDAPDETPASENAFLNEADMFEEDDAILDEEALRDLVAEIVRQELQGSLGERITRNVRKLVRREIHRALAAQELD